MRQRFEQQIRLGTTAIKEVSFERFLKSRDELPSVLMALQHIFSVPELNEKIFSILENAICKGKKKTGRKGMDLWHILVLATVRHATGANWDKLALDANENRILREIMGVHSTYDNVKNGIFFEYQNILDNVSLIDEQILYKINQVVVEAGYQLVKKKEDEGLQLKTDSYAVETNVHFPTDLNLLWDSVRKCFDIIKNLQNETGKIEGWRKIKNLRSGIKSLFRATSQQVFKGKNEREKQRLVKEYITASLVIKQRCELVHESLVFVPDISRSILTALIALRQYCVYVEKFADQVERRIIKGEEIPAEEKIFSIFEPHTEWIYKGKQNKRVELGHLLLITTDQHQFIVDYKIMEKQKDPAQVKPLLERIKQNYPTKKIESHSFDKGFWSKDNFDALKHSSVEMPVLPKRGRHNKEDKERENNPDFKKLRRKHSAVESNINMLEHHSLNRCVDKGFPHFKRYVGLSVLAYNLHIMGNALLTAERKKKIKLQQRRLKAAA